MEVFYKRLKTARETRQMTRACFSELLEVDRRVITAGSVVQPCLN